MKKTIVSIAASAALIFAQPAFAAVIAPGPTPPPTPPTQQQIKACVKTAKQVRNNTEATARQTFQATRASAVTVRNAAIAAATGNKAAKQAARAAFKATVVQAKTTRNTAIAAADTTLATTTAACSQ